MPLSNYTFDKDEHSLALVTFSGDTGGGGYEDKCGNTWTDYYTTRTKIKNKWFLRRPFSYSRFVLINSSLTDFTADQDWTLEFLHFKINNDTFSSLWRNYQYSDASYGPSIDIRTNGGYVCESMTRSYASLSYRNRFTDFYDSDEKLRFVNHYAVVKKSGVVYYFYNGTLKDSFAYNRRNDTSGASEVGYSQYSDYFNQDDGLLSLHVSNVGRYTENFDYTPLDLNDPVGEHSILKVY